MQTGHIHKELIRAWAAGAIIQFQNWRNEWTDCINNDPEWIPKLNYRVKPEPKPDYFKFIGLYEGDSYHDTSVVYTDISGIPQGKNDDAGHWNLCNKLELVFDGETKELKEVKIHGKD